MPFHGRRCLDSADQLVDSNIRSTTSERFAQLRVLMRELQDMLGKTGCLDHTPDFDRAFVLDQSSYRLEEEWRELLNHSHR